MEFRTFEFVAPSGFTYEIREQNGADEDILGNIVDFKTLMNFTKFISAIVVRTDFTSNGKLTIEDALSLPVNDRYAIIIHSRIFSLGEEVNFEYDWGKELGGKITYSQDLREFLFDDYDSTPTDEDVKQKPDAIPYYPNGKNLTDIPIETSSGKSLIFDCMTGEQERAMIQLPASKQSQNTPLLFRNLRLKVDDKFEKVHNFSLFSPRDMKDIRRAIYSIDPVFNGTTTIENPNTGQEEKYFIFGAPDFFFLTED